jgi:hypothetical protein
MGSSSISEILFILAIVAMMAAPPGLVVYFTWRKLFRRIDHLEKELDGLRADSYRDELERPSSSPASHDHDD